MSKTIIYILGILSIVGAVTNSLPATITKMDEICDNGIDDDGTTATPFDVENNFPGSNYTECFYENNISEFDFGDCGPLPNIEICNNGIDDDGDGLIDCFDPDCCENQNCLDNFYDPCQKESCSDLEFEFDIEAQTINASDLFSTVENIVGGDMDGDGNIEIIGTKSWFTEVLIVDLATGQIKANIPVNDKPRFAIGDIILTNTTKELIIAANDNLYCYDPNGTLIWSNALIPTNFIFPLGLADFNEDGISEIYIGNQILNGLNGDLLVSLPEGMGNIAADFLDDSKCPDCEGLEYLIGHVLYAINIQAGTATPQATNSKFSNFSQGSVIDWNLDGNLDIISKSFSMIEVWDPIMGTLVNAALPSFTGNVAAGNLDQDPEPELVYIGQDVMILRDNDLSIIWSLPIDDQSGSTGITLFDFNQDGIFEIVYRDEQNLRIINAESSQNISLQTCTSNTLDEYPIILDADDDGEAEIITVCGGDHNLKGNITVFSSANGNKWPDTRPVWNQINFFNIHINDDLTIPREQQDILLLSNDNNLNGFLSAYPIHTAFNLDLVVTNVEVDNACLFLNINVCNEGTDTYTESAVPITFYNSDPTSTTVAQIIDIEISTNNIAADECVVLMVPITGNGFDLNNYSFGMINENGTALIPFDFPSFPNTVVDECSFVNNLFTFDTSCPEIEICDNGIDDDGDGLIDAFDPDCDCSDNMPDWIYTGEIVVTDECLTPVYLSVPFSNTLNYQWYQDSIPMPGEVSSTLTIDPTNNEDSQFTVFVYNDDGCRLVGPVQIGFCPTQNLTFDSYKFFNNCDYLIVTICNTGDASFTEPMFHVSLYDSNPINQTAAKYTSLSVINDLTFASGECRDLALDISSLTGNSEDIYGIINDQMNVPTPFDFNADFPTTNFEEDTYLDNVFVFNIDNCDSPLIEDCNNGFDDDGDGLIDAFDPDCECLNEGSITNTYIQNSGFEEHTGCCSEIEINQSCVDGWEGIDGTADYYGLDCIPANQIPEIEEVHVYTFDDSYISFGTAQNYSETMGSCLLSPLIAGKSYLVEITASLPEQLLVNLPTPIEFTLYGFSGTCPDFSTLTGTSTNNFCLTSHPAQAEELITISSVDLLNFEFSDYNVVFTPSSNISYVILSIKCDELNQGSSFIQIAYIQISDTENTSWEYDEEILVSNPCDDLVTFSVPYSDSLNYQWYIDSIPVFNATTSILEVDPDLFNSASQFHVFVYNENGCELLGPNYIEPIIISPTEIDTSICQGDTFNVGDQVYTLPGYYSDTLESKDGCDSLVQLTLNFASYLESYKTKQICAGTNFVFGNQVLNTSGTYTDTVNSLFSCDTIISLDLTVLNPLKENLPVTICEGTGISFAGSIITSEGQYFDTLNSITGCDSIIELDLTIAPRKDSLTLAMICEGETFNFNGLNFTATGIYVDTLSSISGCDSLITLDLQVIDKSDYSLQESICNNDFYDFNGKILSIQGDYSDTLINAEGCDSIVVLSLEVVDIINNYMVIEMCSGESFFFGNDNITETGIYIDTIVSISSCDSIITLDLSVEDESGSSFQDSICLGDSYYFAGIALEESGVYYDTLSTTTGCDSIVTFSLSKRKLPEDFLDQTICDGEDFQLGAQFFDEPGIYNLSIESPFGCDTMMRLNLTVEPAKIGDTTFAIINEGEFYNFQNVTFDVKGIYEVIIPSHIGCDSLVYLDLNITNGVHIPNVFSVNSAMGNDRFIIAANENIIINHYNIYDRWGNLVYSKKSFNPINGEDNFWDGYMNGIPVEKGVYIYSIEYLKPNGVIEEAIGTITVL